MPGVRSATEFDDVIVGGGHNGLVAAVLLARAGRRVVVLERAAALGGAAVSASPFPGLDVRLSRYSYLVSLFPQGLFAQLGIVVEMRRRSVSSYTPHGDSGLLVCSDPDRTRASFARLGTGEDDHAAWERFYARTAAVAERVFPTVLEPLRSREDFRQIVDDETAWPALFEQPLSAVLERSFAHDLVRGVVATDALIGTFASLSDPELGQNRCFLYHVIGNGTGHWDVPVGGMGALTGALIAAAGAAGAELRPGSEVVALTREDGAVTATLAGGEAVRGGQLLCGAAPAVLAALLGEDPGVFGPAPEGAQLKLNLLLSRLPRLRDTAVSPAEAFGGTFHVNEGYAQLEAAYAEADAGQIPSLPPCEAYCHSLTDPSILSAELRAAGAQTLTVFGLHMPARLFREDPARAKREAVAATLRSINTVLAEPIETCLMSDGEGEPCLEARTPLELESELALPAGHIFHRHLAWPFAEADAEAGRWGVETPWPNVWLCGAGARRGGGVSGIPGHNAARALAGESIV